MARNALAVFAVYDPLSFLSTTGYFVLKADDRDVYLAPFLS